MRTHPTSPGQLGAGLIALLVGSSGCSPTTQADKPRSGDETAPALAGETPPRPAEPAEPPLPVPPRPAPVIGSPPDVGGAEGIPPVNPIEAAKLAEALRSVDDGSAAMAAAVGLAELEAQRLPAYLTTALKEYAAVAPEQRTTVVSREIGSAEGQEAWARSCAGGMVVFQEVAVAPAEAKASLLFERCDLGRLGLFDAEAAAKADPSALLLATMTADHLRREGTLSDAEAYAISKMSLGPDEPTP